MRKSPLLPIFLIVAVDILGLTIIIPLLPFYAERFGATPQVVGILTASYAICQFLAGPILGKISDRVGRRPLLLVSQVGTFIGFLILGWAHTLTMVFVSRIIDGITAGNISLAQAYIADVTEPENRTRAFGLIGVSFGFGFLIGPAISGFLAQYGYQYPIYAAAALSAISIIATYFLLPRTLPHESHGETRYESDETADETGRRLSVFDFGAYAKFFKHTEIAPLLWQFLCFTLTFSLFISGFALFAERRFTWHDVPFGPREVGFMYAYAGFLGLILQGGLIGRLTKKYGEKKLILTGFMAAAVGYVMLGLTFRFGFLIIVTMITSYGTGVLRPAITSLITRAASRREQGVVLGLTQSVTSVAQIFCPLLAGALIGRSHLMAWSFCAAGAALIGYFVAQSQFSKSSEPAEAISTA